MTNLTVYDLMAEDHILLADLKKDGRVHVVITDSDEHEIKYSEESHINAWESLVYFAKQVLACDERLRQGIEINE